MTPSSTTGSTIGSQDDHDAPEANAQVNTGGEAPADATSTKRPRRRATRSVVSTAKHVEPIVVGSSDTPATPAEGQPVTTGGTAAVATPTTPAAGE
ncbi:hypothetical protein, partial [Promicromonospora kroppenstedtii]|uniref:hypothetical protein n=1 Tax=Promicromonospora kroppenstedtii TaxID=440482 RepID=UPI0005617EF6